MGRHVDTTEVRKLAVDLTKAGPMVRRKAPLVVKKTLFDIEGDAKVLAPVDLGALESSISTDVDTDGMGGEVGPTVDYGDDVEYGTEPHVIRARAGGKLVFKGRDGRLVFVDKVNHPGTPPQPYMGPAFDRRIPGFEAALGKIGEDIL